MDFAGQGTQERLGQQLIIPLQRCAGNFRHTVLHPEFQLRKHTQHCRPRPALGGRGLGDIQHTPFQPVPKAAPQARQEPVPNPRPVMAVVDVRRVLVNGERLTFISGAGRKPLRDLSSREREERSNHAARALGRNPRQARRPTSAQEPKQHRFHLIVGVMRGHQVASTRFVLDTTERSVARVACPGLRGVGAQLEAGQANRERVTRGQARDPVRDLAALETDTVIDMGDHELQSELRGERGEQVEHRDRIGSTADRKERTARLREERPVEQVCAEPPKKILRH